MPRAPDRSGSSDSSGSSARPRPRPAPGGARTELVWPGKYGPGGRRGELALARLPLVPREIIDPARLRADSPLPDPPPAPSGGLGVNGGNRAPSKVPAWRNRLVLGDNALLLEALAAELEGKIDLVYIDPPFATGSDFKVAMEVGRSAVKSRRRGPVIEGRAFGDSWGRDPGPYLEAIHARLVRIRRLLSPRGTLWVHLDRRVAHYVKLVLDEVFGEDHLINEVAWCYTGPGSPAMKGFSNKHDTLFWYANGDSWTFNVDPVRLPYKESTKRNEGRRTGFTTGNPALVVALNPLGKHPEDWWTIPVEAPASRRRTPYPTQKPERLLERIVLAASREGDLVADFYSGSGTALAVAERLGRRWIGCDSSPLAIHTARKRLLEMPPGRPFEVASIAGGAAGASLDARIVRSGPELAEVVLRGYVAPDSPSLSETDRAKLGAWSDAIDSWAVDWDFQPDGIFRPSFVSSRSRAGRDLPLRAGPHRLGRRAALRVAVKAFDVFGNEALAILEA